MKNIFRKSVIIMMTLALVLVGGIPQAEAANSHLIIINSKTNKLGYFVNTKLVREFSVATGKKGTETPLGKTKIVNKIKNRPYYKTNIPGGSPRNPLGDRWLGLRLNGTNGTTYAIHGNNNPSSIGKHVSGGCVRMHNKEIRWLFDQVPVGTTVIINYSNDSYAKIAEKNGINLNSKPKPAPKPTPTPAPKPTPIKTGWKTENGNTYYVKSDGSYYKKVWLKLNGKVYYFDESGVMQKGWKVVDNKKYYLGNDGARVVGWQQIDNKKYYFAQDGQLLTGWQQIDNKQYYLGTDGVMATGKITIDGKEYTFNPDGTINPNWDTVIGENRFDTAKKVSTSGNWTPENTDTVVLVNGNAIADGITATPLANSYNASILLTNTTALPNETIAEIERLAPSQIILIGGNNAIGSEVENQIKARFKVEPKRIAGNDRYETAFKIAKELETKEQIQTAYVVYGGGEPDALSIASKAGEDKQPIILTQKDNINEEVYTWLSEKQLTNAYFIGGQNAISDKVISDIDKITTEDVTKNRVAGKDRADTNAKVIARFYPDANLNSVLVAKSDVLVDALTAGPLASKLQSPVVLMGSNGLSQEQSASLNGKKSPKVYQIGGGINFKSVDKLVDTLK